MNINPIFWPTTFRISASVWRKAIPRRAMAAIYLSWKFLLRLANSSIVLAALLVSTLGSASAAGDIRRETKSEIDVANINDGYFSARSISKNPKRLKLITSYVKPSGTKVEYRYDLNGDGAWETYSLQSGNGEYAITIFENTNGSKYTPIQAITINVKYSRKNAPFLIPAQNVNYDASSNAVKKADELSKNASTDLKKVENIYKYIVETIKYDTGKAKKVAAGELTGYLPKIDDTLETSKGICFDYSSLFAAMLRSQDIPAKLIMGYAAVSSKPTYHAWNEVYTEETGWIKIRSEVQFKGKNWERMDSTFASSNTNGAKTKFISEDKFYTKEKEY